MKEQKETILEQTAKLLEVSKEEIERKLSQGWVKEDSFVPLKIVNPADTELVNKLLAIPSVKKKCNGKNVSFWRERCPLDWLFAVNV